MRDGAGSFYRTELALAHARVEAVQKLLRAAEARFPSKLGPGDLVVHAGRQKTIHGVYFTPGRVQYRLSDGSNAEASEVGPVVPPVPTPLNTLCSVCGRVQYQTPSGVTCAKGHGGAPSI